MTNVQRAAEAKAIRRLHGLRIVSEGSVIAPDFVPAERTPLLSPREVYAFMLPFAAEQTTEVFWALPLDSQHRLISTKVEQSDGSLITTAGPLVITRGILNSSLVHPREVFRALIVHGAAAAILCHNHPSGDPTPSADDRLITNQLRDAGRLLDLPIFDHVICGAGRYVSFAEAGLL
jgi:DNA repair protein RadC